MPAAIEPEPTVLRNVIGRGPLLSRGLRNAVAALVALLYVCMYANARALLPEFIFRDADKIQTQIGGGSTYDGSSFDAVGKLYQALGDAGTAVFVVALGIATIAIALRHARRFGEGVAYLALIAPCLFFNLFVPQATRSSSRCRSRCSRPCACAARSGRC